MVKFCKKCTISNFRPSSTVETNNKGQEKEYISFDENGVCAACNYHEKRKNINWEEKEKELLKLLEKHRGKNKCGYDVIVPASGGKDSCFVAHLLKFKYDMNPLIVTWSPNIWTDIGFQNYRQMLDSGFDGILYTSNGRLRRLLTKLSFINLCHPFQSFIIVQKSIGAMFATKYNIPLVFYGEDGRLYGNDDKKYKGKMDISFYSKSEIKNEDIMLGGVSIKEIIDSYSFKMDDFTPYLPLNTEVVKKNKLEVRYMADYIPWNPQENFYYASQHCGFKPNVERTEGSYSKYSSIDDKVDNFHYYTTLIKFGLGRASYDSSQEIRNNIITREEGVNLVHKYDQEFPKKYFKDFLEYIDITEDKFWEIIDKNISSHLWEKNNGVWKLTHIVQ